MSAAQSDNAAIAATANASFLIAASFRGANTAAPSASLHLVF
jgi:hypothetical protein